MVEEIVKEIIKKIDKETLEITDEVSTIRKKNALLEEKQFLMDEIRNTQKELDRINYLLSYLEKEEIL